MNVAYIKSTEISFFSDAKTQLNTMIEQLESEDYAHKEHGDIEEHIEEQGYVLLRCLFQGYLDKEASNESREPSINNASGEALTHVRQNTQRKLTTLFGSVEVRRKSYEKQGHQSLFPMDAKFNLPGDQYSDGLRKRLSKEVINCSFDNAVDCVKDTSGAYIPKRQSLDVVRNVAQDFESYYEQKRYSVPEDSDGILVLTFDGKGMGVVLLLRRHRCLIVFQKGIISLFLLLLMEIPIGVKITTGFKRS